MEHAIIRNGIVENVILWDGEANWSPPPGSVAVQCPAHVGIGWTYDGSEFAPPAPDAEGDGA